MAFMVNKMEELFKTQFLVWGYMYLIITDSFLSKTQLTLFLSSANQVPVQVPFYYHHKWILLGKLYVMSPLIANTELTQHTIF